MSAGESHRHFLLCDSNHRVLSPHGNAGDAAGLHSFKCVFYTAQQRTSLQAASTRQPPLPQCDDQEQLEIAHAMRVHCFAVCERSETSWQCVCDLSTTKLTNLVQPALRAEDGNVPTETPPCSAVYMCLSIDSMIRNSSFIMITSIFGLLYRPYCDCMSHGDNTRRACHSRSRCLCSCFPTRGPHSDLSKSGRMDVTLTERPVGICCDISASSMLHHRHGGGEPDNPPIHSRG